MNDDALETSAELSIELAANDIDPRLVPVRISNLKRIALSPAHYIASIADPRAPKPHLRIGKLAHALILGGQFVVWEGKRDNSKAFREFKAVHVGEEIVTRAEHSIAERIRDSVYRHREAPALLVGERERKIAWKIGDRECLSHIDVVGDADFVTELKTSTTTKPDRFNRLGTFMGYHAQLAWYQDACAFVGAPKKDAYIVAVETSPPYAVTVMKLTPRALEEGRKLCRLWFEQLTVCEQTNSWPAYCESIVDFDVPDDVSLIIDGEEAAVA